MADRVYIRGSHRFPSVTTVLPFRAHASKAAMRKAMERGQKVHRACEYSDDCLGLDWDTVDPELVPYVRAWERFKIESGWQIELIETRLLSAKYGYGGKLDRTARKSRNNAVIDIKSNTPSPTAALQLAAYENLLRENGLLRGKCKRIVVQLMSTGKYRLHFYDRPGDFRVFLAYLTTYKWAVMTGLIVPEYEEVSA